MKLPYQIVISILLIFTTHGINQSNAMYLLNNKLDQKKISRAILFYEAYLTDYDFIFQILTTHGINQIKASICSINFKKTTTYIYASMKFLYQTNQGKYLFNKLKKKKKNIYLCLYQIPLSDRDQDSMLICYTHPHPSEFI